MLQLKDVSLTLGKGTPLERCLFNDFSFDVKPGEFVVVIGGNGTGKSTLMNIISGYQTIDQGSVIIDNVDVSHYHQSKRACLISHVMQDPKIGTMPSMTIEENMSFALKRGLSRGFSLHNTAKRRDMFREALERLGMNLENRLNDFVGSLSGGQRQGLALVMSTLGKSKILLLDEITAALDPRSATNVMQLAFEYIKERQMTSIMITHNMNHALQFGDRTLLMKDGLIIKSLSALEKETLCVVDLLKIYGEV